MLIGAATMENNMKFPQKIENRTTIWSSNCIPGHISRENHKSKRYIHTNVQCSTIYNSQDIEATYMFINREMDKEDVVNICYRILFSHKKERNNAICNNMDEPRDYHTKWIKSDGEKQTSYDVTHIWNLKKTYNMNLFAEQK